jgi:acyl-CoA thioester hydrolase
MPGSDPSQPEGSFGLIFAECQIFYRSPGHFDEEVSVDLRVGEVRRSSFKLEFRMRVGERLLADGYGTLVGYEYEHQRAAPLPEGLRERLSSPPA